MEKVCHLEHQKPAVFAAAVLPQQTHLATVKITKARAGNPINRDNPDSSADMVQSGKSYEPAY